MTERQDKHWSSNDIEKLIRLWQENDELYNVKHPLYLDRKRKSLIIHAEMAEKLNTAVEEVVKKLRSLHSYYFQLRSESKEPNPSGSSTSASKKKRVYYNSLQFLSTNFVSELTVENIDTGPSELKSSNANTTRKRREGGLSAHAALMERAVKAFENDATPSSQTITEDQLFGNMVTLKMSKLTNGDEEDLKREILNSINGLQRSQRRERENNIGVL